MLSWDRKNQVAVFTWDIDNYPWDTGRSDTERAFLARLEHLCAGPIPIDAWTYYPQLVVTLSISDSQHRVIVRTLRVDFSGASLAGGDDPSGQIDPDLDSESPDYFVVAEHLAPSAFADLAFEWFRREADRPIDRLEWDESDNTWYRWQLADQDGRPLVGQYGNLPDRPPDRVVRISHPWRQTPI